MEYVYILSNPENLGKVKIGRTKKHPEIRVNSLNRNAGVYGEYQLEWYKQVIDSIVAEKVLHHAFRIYRVQKEFFAIETSYSIKIANIAMDKLSEIETLTSLDVEETIKNLKQGIEALIVAKEFTEENIDRHEIDEGIKSLESQLREITELKKK